MRPAALHLGATAYELARGKPLPSSGNEYQSMRQGKMTLLPGFSVGAVQVECS
jgi:wee1-like protein kinase